MNKLGVLDRLIILLLASIICFANGWISFGVLFFAVAFAGLALWMRVF